MLANMFFAKYPYTDLEQLNLTWVIDVVNQVDTDLSSIREECKEIAHAEAQAVSDQLTEYVNTQINDIQLQLDQFRRDFDLAIQDLDDRYAQFIRDVDATLHAFDLRIQAFKQYIDDQITIVNATTDAKIANNTAYIFDEITNNLVPNLTVIDFFTGNKISIQAMFDKLATLHITDGIDYAELANRNKTYADLTAYYMTYTDMLEHGNTIIV